jgi:putative transposase
MDYRYGSHTVFQIEYHFVWVTKYRYKVLTGDDRGASTRVGPGDV